MTCQAIPRNLVSGVHGIPIPSLVTQSRSPHFLMWRGTPEFVKLLSGHLPDHCVANGCDATHADGVLDRGGQVKRATAHVRASVDHRDCDAPL